MNLYTWICFQLLFLVLYLLSFVGQRLYFQGSSHYQPEQYLIPGQS